ncbi:MAG: hypothetical protein RRY64_01025 [Oscillospiraceae bacterium]
MKQRKHEIWRRVFLMVVPLLLLASFSFAWFVRSLTVPMNNMTFASTSSGVSPKIFMGTVETETLLRDPNNKNLITGVTSTVTWSQTALAADSAFVVEGLQPGQALYFKLSCATPAHVSLSNVQQFDKDGKLVQNVQLADYLGFYAVPLTDGAALSSTVTLPLTRKATVPPATADTYLTGAHIYWNTIGDLYPQSPLLKDYVFVIYCDTENHNSKGTDGVTPPLSTLTGKVSFKLTFAA